MKKAAKVVNPEDRITPGKILLYIVLILVSAFTLIPFVWMISASLKLDREVFTFPMKWIPETPHWENYSVIWTKVPMLTYFGYAISTFLFAFLLMLRLHVKPLTALFTAVIAVVIVLLLFNFAFRVSLPAGELSSKYLNWRY